MSITDVTIFDNLNNFKDLSETLTELACLKKNLPIMLNCSPQPGLAT